MMDIVGQAVDMAERSINLALAAGISPDGEAPESKCLSENILNHWNCL